MHVSAHVAMESRGKTRASGEGGWRQALLAATHRVAEVLGGSVPLPLLGTDPEVLEIGQQQQLAVAGGGRISLKRLLEDACLGAPRAARVVVRERSSDPFPIVCTSVEASGKPPSPLRRRGPEASSSSATPAKRIRLDAPLPRTGGGVQERPAGRVGGGSSPMSGGGGAARTEGVEVFLLSNNIPVVTLDRGSVFDLNASWLLQNTVGLYQKADSLYEDAPRSSQYKKIISECLQRGLATSDQELWVVRLTKKPECVAVGTCGKRSVMMALVVAAAICPGGQRIALEDLEEMELRRPYEKLMVAVKRVMDR